MNQPLIILDGLSLHRDQMLLLDDIQLKIRRGDFHVLVGANGSSKTTLIHTLSGVIPYTEYSGAIYFDGAPLRLRYPGDALAKGIVTMHQDTYLFEDFTVAENLFPDTPYAQPQKGRYGKKEKQRRAQELLDHWGVALQGGEAVSNLTVAQKRMLDIVRLTTYEPRLLILDEPTDGFDDRNLDVLLNILGHFKKKQITMIYITHKYEEIMHLADRVSIIKDGQLLETLDAGELQNDAFQAYRQTQRYPKLSIPKGKELLGVRDFSCGAQFGEIDLTLHQGEILGVTGLEDSGKSLLGRALFGLEPQTRGSVYVDRLPAKIRTPQDAISLGLAYVTDDRIASGLFGSLSTVDNVYAVEHFQEPARFRSPAFENAQFRKYGSRLNLDINPEVRPMVLSGGEQQKLLLLRWIMSTAKIFIMDKPTGNLDISSKIDTYNLINDLVRKKAGVLIISSDIEELMGICDSILVMKKGRVVFHAARSQPDDFEQIYRYI